MTISRNRNTRYSNHFNFIKLFIFSQILIEAYFLLAGSENKFQTPVTQAYPNFFVNATNTIFFNPLIINVFDKRITKIDSKLNLKLSTYDASLALQFCDAAIYEIVNEDSWVARDQLIADIISKELKFILTSPELSYNHTSLGSYIIKHRQILISYKPEFKKGHYKTVLLNELFSHLSVMSNQRCNVSTKEYQLMSVPFLNKNGTINLLLMKDFNASITLGLARIEEIKIILKQRRRRNEISNNKRNLLTKFYLAAKGYVPRMSYISLDYLINGTLKVNDMIGDYLIQYKGYLQPGPKMKGTPFFRGKIVGNYLISHQTHNTQTCAGRLRAFFADFEHSRTSMDKEEGPYAKLASHYKTNEFGSFIAELPKPLLELIFPQFMSIIKSRLLKCGPSSNLHGGLRA